MMRFHRGKSAVLGLGVLFALAAGCSKGSDTPTGPPSDHTAPTVMGTSPADGGTGVGAITATFSEAMASSTISTATFSLSGPGGAAVPGAVGYGSLNNTARFTPDNSLVPGTQYEATITIGVEDLAGNAMVLEKTWTFTTTAAQPQGPVTPPGSRRTF